MSGLCFIILPSKKVSVGFIDCWSVKDFSLLRFFILLVYKLRKPKINNIEILRTGIIFLSILFSRIKMAIIKNPVKGYIRNMSAEEVKKYEEREERLKKEGKK